MTYISAYTSIQKPLAHISHKLSGNLHNLLRQICPQSRSPCRFDNVLAHLRTNFPQHLAQIASIVCEKYGLEYITGTICSKKLFYGYTIVGQKIIDLADTYCSYPYAKKVHQFVVSLPTTLFFLIVNTKIAVCIGLPTLSLAEYDLDRIVSKKHLTGISNAAIGKTLITLFYFRKEKYLLQVAIMCSYLFLRVCCQALIPFCDDL